MEHDPAPPAPVLVDRVPGVTIDPGESLVFHCRFDISKGGELIFTVTCPSSPSLQIPGPNVLPAEMSARLAEAVLRGQGRAGAILAGRIFEDYRPRCTTEQRAILDIEVGRGAEGRG